MVFERNDDSELAKTDRRRLVFLAKNRPMAEKFWSTECDRLADELGFAATVPALLRSDENDIDDWTPWVADADALITTWGSPCCNSDFLANAPKARIVGHSAGSVATVVDATTYRSGLAVTTANPVMAEAVAEWSLLATLLAQRAFAAYAQIGTRTPLQWGRRESVRDLRATVVGIWGLGDISRHLIRLLAVLRPGRILVCSNHASARELADFGAEKVDLDTLLAEADVLHCLAGANRANHFRIDARELSLMKNGATLVNAGRAWLIREEPLLEELRSGRIKGIFDVFYQEPLPEDSPWRELENVILTPHNAGYSGYRRYAPFILEEFRRFFSGSPLRAPVDLKRWRTMTDERLGCGA